MVQAGLYTTDGTKNGIPGNFGLCAYKLSVNRRPKHLVSKIELPMKSSITEISVFLSRRQH